MVSSLNEKGLSAAVMRGSKRRSLFAQEGDAYKDRQKAVSCTNKKKGSGFWSYYVNSASITTARRTDEKINEQILIG